MFSTNKLDRIYCQYQNAHCCREMEATRNMELEVCLGQQKGKYMHLPFTCRLLHRSLTRVGGGGRLFRSKAEKNDRKVKN